MVWVRYDVASALGISLLVGGMGKMIIDKSMSSAVIAVILAAIVGIAMIFCVLASPRLRLSRWSVPGARRR